ncbi:methyl-accepting chemotaxis protein [Dendrosporobacter sp. 1207_IL3150]|uniref:methyl-accepting chemotaxis protein n=1 Tax=Dendrosporobacter sp. 1207_IL3150 TaxID=3084054 RepID=UPI002FDB6F2B
MAETSLLDSFVQVSKYIPQLLSGKVGMVVSDHEKWLVSYSIPELQHQVVAGEKIKTGAAVHQAMQKRTRVVVEVSKEVYGIPYIAISMPITDSAGKILGAVAVHESLERKEVLQDAAGHLSNSANVLSSSLQSILAQAEELAASGQYLKDLAVQANKEVSETDSVINFIKNVASQTNLLGLNAAIEAARVGEQGRGFGVVAEEVRKLAVNSSSSAAQITTTLKRISDSIQKITHEITQIDSVNQHQAQTIEKLTGQSQDLLEMSAKLAQMAAELNADQKCKDVSCSF